MSANRGSLRPVVFNYLHRNRHTERTETGGGFFDRLEIFIIVFEANDPAVPRHAPKQFGMQSHQRSLQAAGL
jgi:hypothetical protein